jgi:hypothetical protein
MLSPIGNTLNVFRDNIVEPQFSFLDKLHDHGDGHHLGIRGNPKMRIGARRRAA